MAGARGFLFRRVALFCSSPHLLGGSFPFSESIALLPRTMYSGRRPPPADRHVVHRTSHHTYFVHTCSHSSDFDNGMALQETSAQAANSCNKQNVLSTLSWLNRQRSEEGAGQLYPPAWGTCTFLHVLAPYWQIHRTPPSFFPFGVIIIPCSFCLIASLWSVLDFLSLYGVVRSQCAAQSTLLPPARMACMATCRSPGRGCAPFAVAPRATSPGKSVCTTDVGEGNERSCPALLPSTVSPRHLPPHQPNQRSTTHQCYPLPRRAVVRH